MKDLIQYAAILVVILVVTLIVLSFQLPEIRPQRFVYNNNNNNKNKNAPRHHSKHRHDGPLSYKHSSSSTATANGKQKHRVAVLLPFIGSEASDIPPYLDLFCFGASGSAAVADFLIVHNGVFADYDDDDDDDDNKNDQQQRPRPCQVATNVHFINLHNTTNMARLFLRVLDEKMRTDDGGEANNNNNNLAIPYKPLLQLLTIHLDRYPYILVEFKPALGYILQDYLLANDDDDDDDNDEDGDDEEDKGKRRLRPYKYTHWAYSDLDILWGDLNRHLEPDEWNDYHVVTFSFGDQQRLYARGQFTMHQLPKTPVPSSKTSRQHEQKPELFIDLDQDDSSLLTLWKPCPYLTHLDVRFAQIVHKWQEQQKQQQQGNDAHSPLFQLESAEGCYSVALLQNEDISVKFAVKAWTDEQHAKEVPHAKTTATTPVDTIPTHGLYVSRGTRPGSGDGDEMVVVLSKPAATTTATPPTTMMPTSTMATWWQNDSVYRDDSLPLQQQAVGAMEPLTLPTIDTTSSNNHDKSKNCMYWVQEQYQAYLCLQNNNHVVTATDNVFWVKGQLYKQSFQNRPLKNNTMLTAPFFHFQEWKRSFRFNQLAPASTTMTRQESSTMSSSPLALAGFVLGPEGVMPLHYHESTTTTTTRRMRLGGGGGSSTASHTPSAMLTSPLGIPPYEWKAGRASFTTDGTANAAQEQDKDHRSQLPWNYYCLSFDKAERFAAKCRFTTSWQDAESVHVISWAPAWQKLSKDDVNDDVTLVLTWQIDLTQQQQQQNTHWQDFFESVVITNLQKWQGQPIVLVIALQTGATTGSTSPSTEEALAFLRERLSTGIDKQGILQSALIAIVVVPPPPESEDTAEGGAGGSPGEQDRMTLSRKALLNMAMDCVPTRWHLAGLEMERGLILSTQTVVFAHRAADTHGTLRLGGNVFWLPQFGLTSTPTTTRTTLDADSAAAMRMTLPHLLVARQKHHIKPLSFYDSACTSLSSSSSLDSGSSGLDTLWWTQTTAMVDPTGGGEGENGGDDLGRRAALLQEAEQDILSLLTPEKFDLLLEEALFSSPLLLTDNIGPQRGMLTHLMARHVEEFVGDHCFNPLQLAQLVALGYRLNVLEGAFALSTDPSRKISAAATTTKSRCYTGCLLFDSKHDDLLQSIAHEEIARPAKTGILQAEMMDTN